MTPVTAGSEANVILGSGAPAPVILRSGATKDLLCQSWMGRSRSFAALRMTEGGG